MSKKPPKKLNQGEIMFK